MTKTATVFFALAFFQWACAFEACADDSPTSSASPNPNTDGPCASATAKSGAPLPDEFQAVCSTWQRFGVALNRGDRDAALAEISSSTREHFLPLVDALLKSTDSFEIAKLGTVSAISSSGRTATLTLIRKKDDRSVAFSVSMVKGWNGKWLIAGM